MKLSDDAAPGSIASVRASTRASRKRSRDVVIESAQLFVKSSRRRAAVSDDEVTVMFCGDFCVPNLHTLDDMHSAFVRFVFVLLFVLLYF